jgi:hypothetical protein
MTDARRTAEDRLRELAKGMARLNHSTTGHSPDKKWHPFDQCEHPDCALVRAAPASTDTSTTIAKEMLAYEGCFGEKTRLQILEWANRLAAAPASAPPQACCTPSPDGWRTCDKPKGHDGDHWTYGGATLTWPASAPPEPPKLVWGTHPDRIEMGPEWLLPSEIHSGPASAPLPAPKG